MGEPPYKGNPANPPLFVTGDTPIELPSHLLIPLRTGGFGCGDLLRRLALLAGNCHLLRMWLRRSLNGQLRFRSY